MMIRGLYLLLKGEPTIAAAAPGGVWGMLLPKEPVLPAVTFQVVGGSSAPTFETSGMQKVRMQFDCWGKGYDDAAGLRDALVRFLNGYTGHLADGTFLQNAELIQPTDFFDEDGRQYRCMAEFYLYFNFL